MKIIEIPVEDKHQVCRKLEEANKALEEAIFKLKEFESESDTRMWRAEGDYRGMGNYRYEDYPSYRYDERGYRDDFRYRR